jgi:hypothetical protein
MDTGPFPNLSAYAARVEQRASVQEALAYADELEARFESN